MSEIIEVKINDEIVHFEIDDTTEYRIEPVGVKESIQQAVVTFQKALDTIHLIANATVEKVRRFEKSTAPDEFELQFGINLSAEYGAVVAKASGEAQLSITLTYKNKENQKSGNN